MKQILTAFLAFLTSAGFAQTPLAPGKASFIKNWIRNETYQMKWYALKDTMKMEIGEVFSSVQTGKKYLTIITEVKMKNSKGTWIDTTIAKASTLQPIMHSSYNGQRDMRLNFGKVVTGFYHDKTKQQHYTIIDTTSAPYFDSNLYPALVTWLPLREGFKQDISIYDYTPGGKKGIMKAFIKNVSSGTYQSTGTGNRDVWIVTVSDEISSGDQNFMTYYIDKSDRRLWKQEINTGGRKMMMVRVEP